MVKRRAEIIALCLIVLLYAGFVPVYNRNPFSCVLQEQSIKSISGKVVSSPMKSSSGTSYLISLDVSEASSSETSALCSGIVGLYVPAEYIEALYPGKLFSSANVALPENDFEIMNIEIGCLLSAEVSYSGSTDGDSLSLLSGNLEKPTFSVKRVTECIWQQSYQFYRAYLRLQLKRLLDAWGAAGGLLLALLCGAREYTDLSVSEAFRKAGLSHILALSGMHLSLFSGLSEKTVGKIAGKRFSSFSSLAAALLFVWFSGLSPSLLRALICMCIGFFASIFCLKTTPVKTLSIAFIIHLIISPEDAGSLAFMLSYLALCGVYVGDWFLKKPLCRIMPPLLASSVSVSIGAQVLTMPLSIAISGSIIPMAVISSVSVSPVASFFVTSGIIAIVFVLIMPFLLIPVGSILSMIYNALIYIVRFFAGIPCIRI
ncbi:MAG: ComEC/Rec2 family competence protein [Treponemataceae bacterium]|nr:ComEC/Rec2 family competence protein [Treponemataceae bacterium]